MKRSITIRAGEVVVTAVLHETPTAEAIWNALPITGRANTWGDEIYFSIPVTAAGEDDAREEVDVGDLGYWMDGRGFCLFFGPTPASSGDLPCAASPVNVFGKVQGDATVLRQVPGGAEVLVERA